jgi:PAS domain-containing protein
MTQVVSEVAEAAEALAATLLQAQKPLVFENAKRPHELLDVLPAAIYTTDAKGRITYFNDAAAALWGCRPRLNSDQWCGSWRLTGPTGRRCRTINARWLWH